MFTPGLERQPGIVRRGTNLPFKRPHLALVSFFDMSREIQLWEFSKYIYIYPRKKEKMKTLLCMAFKRSLHSFFNRLGPNSQTSSEQCTVYVESSKDLKSPAEYNCNFFSRKRVSALTSERQRVRIPGRCSCCHSGVSYASTSFQHDRTKSWIS